MESESRGVELLSNDPAMPLLAKRTKSFIPNLAVTTKFRSVPFCILAGQSGFISRHEKTQW